MNGDERNKEAGSGTASEPVFTPGQLRELKKVFGEGSNRNAAAAVIIVGALLVLINPAVLFNVSLMSVGGLTVIGVLIVLVLKWLSIRKLQTLEQIEPSYRRPSVLMQVSSVVTILTGMSVYFAVKEVFPSWLVYTVVAAAVFDFTILCFNWDAASQLTARFSKELSGKWKRFWKRFLIILFLWIALCVVLPSLMNTYFKKSREKAKQSTEKVKQSPGDGLGRDEVLGRDEESVRDEETGRDEENGQDEKTGIDEKSWHMLGDAISAIFQVWISTVVVIILTIVFAVTEAVGEIRLERETCEALEALGPTE